MNLKRLKSFEKNVAIIAVATAMAVTVFCAPVSEMAVQADYSAPADPSYSLTYSSNVTEESTFTARTSDGSGTIKTVVYFFDGEADISIHSDYKSAMQKVDFDPNSGTVPFSTSDVSSVMQSAMNGSVQDWNFKTSTSCAVLYAAGTSENGVTRFGNRCFLFINKANIPVNTSSSESKASSTGCTPLTPEELYQIQLNKDFPAGNGYVGYGENACFVEAGKDGDAINAWKAGTKIASFVVKDASETVVKSKCLGQKKVGDKYYISISAFSKAGGLHIVISEADKAALKAKGISGIMLDGTKVLMEF
jgi:hypothetical protein